MSSDRTRVHQHGRVLVVEMVRVDKRNAIDRAMADELDEALNRLDDDPEVWAGVLAGSNGTFSAGSDLRSGGDYDTLRGGEYGVIRRRRTKPLVAAVDGPALGGGLEIVLACDLVVASSASRFGLPEVTIGVIPTCAGLFRGPRTLPLNVARELVLTGGPITAERAHQVGLVNVLVEPGKATEGAIHLAERVCHNAPLAVQASLAAVNGLASQDEEQGWSATETALAAVQGSADFEEGVSSFLEKREPRWQAR